MPRTVLSRIAQTFGGLVTGLALLVAPQSAKAQPNYTPIPTQYIAALGPTDATSGNDAETWGLWPVDPGPRGVPLSALDKLMAAGGVAPDNWQFDASAWWLEEHGLIMEAPQFPLPPGRYIVTGAREAVAELTIHPADAEGHQAWELNNGATIYDVTHLRCRAAIYTPATAGGTCSPEQANRTMFPVTPGAEMPGLAGCEKQDYQVLIVIGMATDAS